MGGKFPGDVVPVLQPLAHHAGRCPKVRGSGGTAGVGCREAGVLPAGGKAEETIADTLLILNLILLWVWLDDFFPLLLELLFDR